MQFHFLFSLKTISYLQETEGSNSANNLTATPPESGSCAEGWTRVEGMGCYLYLIDESTWAEASLLCQQQRHYTARLVEVDSVTEAAHLITGAKFSGEE